MGTLGGIPLDVGDVLAKKYRIERLVGEGGTGLVVAATHLLLERVVAIKFLRTALASNDVRTRFEREARAIEQIESEHVVLVLDVGALDDDSPYMVMEYLEGRDLAKILKEEGSLGTEDAVDCMLQVCEVLGQAHAKGIIHRDLKPANLFLTRREDGAPHIKVVDFGISKILDPTLREGGPNDMTAAFTVLGSPRYMAPEQLRDSKDVDGRADLWSIGAVLFQLVAGRPPFEGDNTVLASIKVLTGVAPLLRAFAPEAPPELEAIVDKCLCKDRDGRFQSAAALADALRPFASDRTRESLARMQEAKDAPPVSIGLAVPSVGERIDKSALEAASAASALEAASAASALEAASAASALEAASAASALEAASAAFAAASAAPAAPDPRVGLRQMSTAPTAFRVARGAASGDAPRELRRPPSTKIKVGLALAGVLLALLALGIVAALELTAPATGAVPSASPRAAPANTGPSQAVTVTLDAGRAPP